MNDKDNSAPEPDWIRRLAQRIRHHQMKGYMMYSEDQLVAAITEEFSRADLTRSRPSVPQDLISRSEAINVIERAYKYNGRWSSSAMEALADELRAIPAPSVPDDAVEKCAWTCDDRWDGDMWETGCGQAFQFTTDGPEENQFKFCYKCGKPIDALRISEDETDE